MKLSKKDRKIIDVALVHYFIHLEQELDAMVDLDQRLNRVGLQKDIVPNTETKRK